MFRSKRSRIPDNRDSFLVKINVDQHPRGYPSLAAYLNSDRGAALFRRFGDLHSRVLLYMQVELTQLEEKLAHLDRDDNSKEETNWRVAQSIYRDNGKRNEERKALVEEIAGKLKAYDSQLRRLTRPSKRVHRNFMDYIWTENCLGEDEQNFIFHEYDFVALDEFEDSWFDQWIQRVIGHGRESLMKKIFVSKEDQNKTQDPHVHYYSESRLGTVIKIIIALVSSILIFVPTYVFLNCHLSVKIMAAIALGFALMFASTISVFTSARRQGVFAATAAYCAVLVVFIGNIQSSQISNQG